MSAYEPACAITRTLELKQLNCNMPKCLLWNRTIGWSLIPIGITQIYLVPKTSQWQISSSLLSPADVSVHVGFCFGFCWFKSEFPLSLWTSGGQECKGPVTPAFKMVTFHSKTSKFQWNWVYWSCCEMFLRQVQPWPMGNHLDGADLWGTLNPKWRKLLKLVSCCKTLLCQNINFSSKETWTQLWWLIVQEGLKWSMWTYFIISAQATRLLTDCCNLES